eukprot:1499457-Prymnesium_polylepis.1
MVGRRFTDLTSELWRWLGAVKRVPHPSRAHSLRAVLALRAELTLFRSSAVSASVSGSNVSGSAALCRT